ncbi:MAG: nucleotidyl transferase AbiEii/AbiGii toxin family protein [Candidatus Omnitrophica bacterium]|nr:nucleotidyl transferase AbiEii/AbiGii toxin family protein [Candidatus Omnitrophota bacterium]
MNNELNRQTLEKVVRILNELQIPYYFTGGIVSNVYGDPRFTEDLDLVVSISLNQAEGLFSALESAFRIDQEEMMDAVSDERIFQALDEDTFVKIDFHVGEKIPGAADRAIETTIFGVGPLWVVSKEDAIVSKVFWVSLGSARSEKDIANMLIDSSPVDLALVENLCEQLGILDHFNRIRKKMEEGGIF